MPAVYICEDLFVLKIKERRGVVAYGKDNHIRVKIGDTIWVWHKNKNIYFMSKIVGVETGHSFLGNSFTSLLLDEDTVPKELIER